MVPGSRVVRPDAGPTGVATSQNAPSSRHEEAFVEVLRACGVLSNFAERMLREFNLSLATYAVLRALSDAGERGCSSSAISDQMPARVPDVTRLVDRLERLELVTRARAKDDRRIVIVAIAPKGEELLLRVEPAMRELYSRLLGHLTERDLDMLTQTLGRMRQGLSAVEELEAK